MDLLDNAKNNRNQVATYSQYTIIANNRYLLASPSGPLSQLAISRSDLGCFSACNIGNGREGLGERLHLLIHLQSTWKGPRIRELIIII